jgi:hypothetical protein
MVKVFEPILKLRLKKKDNTQATSPTSGPTGNYPPGSASPAPGYDPGTYSEPPSSTTNYDNYSTPSDPTAYPSGTTPSYDPYSGQSYASSGSPATEPGYYDYNSSSSNVTYSDISSGVPLIAESPAYNTDGTANLGSQNHTMYGCYLDILKGAVMDDIDAAGNSKSVDIIFTATDYYGSAPMYAFLTPSYVKNDFFSNYYFRGAKYKDANIPPKQWSDVVESEIALTPYTGFQFDKIQTNDQLMAVVKQCSGFKDKFESRTKLDGKIFAIKTEIDSRTCYGLLYVVTHYGTTGANGYLKVKLKVTGFDASGDGNPDANLYNMQY